MVSGLDTRTAIVPYSKKSYPPEPSLSAGVVYPSGADVTRPNVSTVTGELPSAPSSSPSPKPASIASRQPSPSESRSKWLGIPSPSVSPSVSRLSRIPSLSSSRSISSIIPSLSLSRNIPTLIQSPPDSGRQEKAGSITDLLILTPSKDVVAFNNFNSSVSMSSKAGAPAKPFRGNGLSISSLKLDPREHPLHVFQSFTLNVEE